MVRRIIIGHDTEPFFIFNDVVTGDANVGNTFVNFGRGSDVLTGGNLDDVFQLKVDSHADAIAGGAGNDWVDYRGSSWGVTVDLSAGLTTINGLPGVATYMTGIENAVGTVFNDVLIGNAADNKLGGDLGFDWVSYANADSGVHIELAEGIVTGDETGTDTLRSVEAVAGSDFDDIYDARGFGGTSRNDGSWGTYNVFEGRGGDDEIWGNGDTLVSYEHATGGVEVNLRRGRAEGNDSVGEDELHNVNAVQGSAFDDWFRASNDADTFVFKGRFGDDTIKDFEAGNGGDHDVILFTNTSVHSFNDVLRHATEDDGDVTIDIDGYGSVTLENVDLHDLTAQNFDFA